MRHLFAIGFTVVATVAVTPTAWGATLNADQILQIAFSTTSPVCPDGACDVLLLDVNEAGSFFATDVIANLYVGNTLLATYSSPSCCAPSFQSPSSLFDEGGTADFTAIDSGISDGIIDMYIGTGYLTWPGTPTPILTIGHAVSPGFVEGGTGIEITSVTILSEPSTAVTWLSGLVFLGFWGCRERFRERL
jgi:hypothetical protein